MKKKLIVLMTLFLMSCQTLKNFEASPECPEDYDCNVEMISNSFITILEDSIGKKYIKIKENDAYHVIKYSYSYKGRPEIADDGYHEEIYFQIPVDQNEIMLNDKNLSDANLIVAKHCFCPDAGFEVVSDGKLEVTKTKNTYVVDLNFSTEKNMKVNHLKTKVNL